ncbi:MAG: glycosyltransferase [Bdellovibrionia bacterium]
MAKSSKVLEIVIPVYHEGEAVFEVYNRLKAALGDFDWKAYFVYDYEKDPTVPFLNKLKSEDSRVHPVCQTYGRGVVNALKYGFDQTHDGAVAVVMGDNSDDVNTLPLMYEKFTEGAVVVASSRHSKDGEYIGGEFLKKHLSRLAGFILYLSGMPTRDPTNNFKLYSGKFLKSVKIESVGGFEIALELTVKAHTQGLKVSEVPGSWKDRTAGESKFKLFKWLPHYLRWFIYALKNRP